MGKGQRSRDKRKEGKKVVRMPARYSDYMCPDCDTEICVCVISRIRKQEEAMKAAKGAIETLEAASIEREGIIQALQESIARYKERYGELEEKNRIITGDKINDAMKKIDRAEQRSINRSRLIDQ
jgi:hypothetical protein